MLLQTTYTLRARTWPVWILFALTALPGILLILTEPHDKGGPILFITGCLVCLIVYGLGKTHRIELDEKGLTFFAYGKKQSMHWADIASTSMSWTVEAMHNASFHWSFYTWDHKQMHLPLGYYSREDMRLLAAQVIEKAKRATVSENIYAIAGGKFPWFLF